MCSAASDEPSPISGHPPTSEPSPNGDATTTSDGRNGGKGHDDRDGRNGRPGVGTRMARRLILGYQSYVSPLKMGPTCRFDPTCSNYALTAIGRHGLIKGSLLALGRLARCGPWHPGGWDPVPPRRPLCSWGGRRR